jgi:hypothetical protein
MTHDAMAANGGTSRRSRTFGGWLRLLGTDRRILASWFVFVAASLIFAYLLMSAFDDPVSAPPADMILLTAAGAGYWAWSMYWGVPGCIAILRRLWRYAFFGFSAFGLAVMGVFFALALIALVYYPPLGGGVFHFLRRWWTSGRGTATPGVPLNTVSARVHEMSPIVASVPTSLVAVQPVAAPPPPALPAAAPVAADLTSDLEQRLHALARLHERGVISRDEHDRRRLAILDTI